MVSKGEAGLGSLLLIGAGILLLSSQGRRVINGKDVWKPPVINGTKLPPPPVDRSKDKGVIPPPPNAPPTNDEQRQRNLQLADASDCENKGGIWNFNTRACEMPQQRSLLPPVTQVAAPYKIGDVIQVTGASVDRGLIGPITAVLGPNLYQARINNHTNAFSADQITLLGRTDPYSAQSGSEYSVTVGGQTYTGTRLATNGGYETTVPVPASTTTAQREAIGQSIIDAIVGSWRYA